MIKKITSVIFGLIVFIATLSGCLTISNPSGRIIRTTTGEVIKKDNSFFPIQSFVMTAQSFILTSEVCSKAGECEQSILSKSSSVASGVIVKTDTDTSYVLTAGHVCLPPPPNTSLPGILKVTYKILLETGFGKRASGNIIAIDEDYDLCLLETSEWVGPGLTMMSGETNLHAKVYNMASPNGLGASIAVPVFDGYYIGKVANRMLFTIPAAPGSSGSPIMNSRNEIITIISAAAIRFDEFAICPTTAAVQAFLLDNIPAKKNSSILDKVKRAFK